MDFVRMLHGPILGLVATIVIVCVIAWAARKYSGLGEEECKVVGTIRNVIIVIAIAGFGWQAITMASYNEVPRTAIDRSVANERADALDEDSHAPASKPDNSEGGANR